MSDNDSISPKTPIRVRAIRLLKLLEEQPDLLVHVSPIREKSQLKTKPKAGEKVLEGKPHYNRSVDYQAVDLKIDLSLALKTNDYRSIVVCYFTLSKLINL